MEYKLALIFTINHFTRDIFFPISAIITMIGIKLKFLFLRMTFSRCSGCDTGRETMKFFWGPQQGQTGIYLYRSAQIGSYSNDTSSPFSVGEVNTYTSDESPPSNSEFQNEWSYNPVLFYTYITCINKTLTFLLCLSYLSLYSVTYLRKGFTALYTILISFLSSRIPIVRSYWIFRKIVF